VAESEAALCPTESFTPADSRPGQTPASGLDRELVPSRTGEGRARAVANGVKLGREPTLTPHQRQEAKRRVKSRYRAKRGLAV